jgi:hypothetical protein
MLTAAFRSFAKAPKKSREFDCKFYADHMCENLQNVCVIEWKIYES